MCTAATYQTRDFYFGRTLDYEFSYGEEIVITPRSYPFTFRHVDRRLETHYAMIGMAHVAGGYPLYYDAINEKGVGMAGLNFVGNAVFGQVQSDGKDIATFEFIPWILAQCASVAEARKLLAQTRLVDTPFAQNMPVAGLHWIIADRQDCIVVENMADGMHIHDNPAGVLTNNPPFEQQMFQLNQYMGLSARQPQNQFSPEIPLGCYSRGMGALGLPGDLSSTSRFARAAFVRSHSISGSTEEESVSQFFHILGSVDQQRGCCEVAEGKYEITIYTSCCNATRGIYYYTTYGNGRICAVDMNREDLEQETLICYPMQEKLEICWQN